MVDAEPAAVDTRTPEEDVVFPYLYALLDEFDALKPSDVEKHLAIPEVPCQPMLASLSRLFEAEELPHDLHERHLRGQLVNLVEAAAVDVLIGEGVQEVVPGLDAQLGFQHFRPRRADAGKVVDGLLLQVFQRVRDKGFATRQSEGRMA